MKGILLINKTINKTSRDMVNELNHIFGIKKIGHTGTLDPIATGVLIMCLGRYTKLVDHLSCIEKEYIAEIKLGISTDTLDITGNIIEENTFNISRNEVEKVLASLVGEIKQTIPKYSAKKINGKKLYEYARNNENIELPQNIINIYKMELLDFHDDIIKFKCLVSKGTYIRSIIQIICEKLGTLGTMNSLVRTKQGKYALDDCYKVDDVKNGNYKLLKAKDVLDYPIYKLNDEEYYKVINGSPMDFKQEAKYLILEYLDEEIAIYQKKDNLYKADVMLID